MRNPGHLFPLQKKTAVKPKNEKQYKQLLELFEKNGWLRSGGLCPTSQNEWNFRKKHICLSVGYSERDLNPNNFDVEQQSFFEKRGYKIISFQELMNTPI